MDILYELAYAYIDLQPCNISIYSIHFCLDARFLRPSFLTTSYPRLTSADLLPLFSCRAIQDYVQMVLCTEQTIFTG